MCTFREVLVDVNHLLVSLCLCITLLPDHLSGQNRPEESPWHPWEFLLGEWVGEGGGTPGEGAGTFSFSTDLQEKVLVRRNHTEYPATQGKPAFSHDDLMVIYREGTNPARAAYFDNEGHVIHYTTSFSGDSSSVVFLSDPVPGAPQFRLTYGKKSAGLVTIQFDIAPPGKTGAFMQYLKGSARRK